MIVAIIAFVEYLIAAFLLTYIAQLATKHKHVWIFFATGLYLFDAHFIVFSYFYDIELWSLEASVLLISSTTLMIGSIILYTNDDLWKHEHEMGMFTMKKKEY